jgi:hypothetical protein
MTREKTSGKKLRTAAGACGLPHAVWEAAANAGGRGVAVKMLRKCAPNLTKVAKALRDGGCGGENFANAASFINLWCCPGGGWQSAPFGGWKKVPPSLEKL